MALDDDQQRDSGDDSTDAAISDAGEAPAPGAPDPAPAPDATAGPDTQTGAETTAAAAAVSDPDATTAANPAANADTTPDTDAAADAEITAGAEAPGGPGAQADAAAGQPGGAVDAAQHVAAEPILSLGAADMPPEPAGPLPDVGEPLVSVDAVLNREPVGGEQPAESAVSDQLVAILEALVFASPEPITPKQLFKLLETEPKEDVDAALAELQRRYDARGGALQVVEVAGGFQIVTRPDLHEWVRRLFHERTTQKLSVQALETLAVIAYKQPITAAEITEIRGVNASGVVGTLLERGLVKISGRKQVVGRPFLYSTTREFLDRFGLKDLGDLPKVEDMADALGFEPPAGIPGEPVQATLPADEPATEEDAAIITGEGEDG
jgi:segregation and condensation protein B